MLRNKLAASIMSYVLLMFDNYSAIKKYNNNVNVFIFSFSCDGNNCKQLTSTGFCPFAICSDQNSVHISLSTSGSMKQYEEKN